MAYTWTDGELITAEKLNETSKMMVVNEDANGKLDKTWQEIYDALEKNTLVLAKMQNLLSVYVEYNIIFSAVYDNMPLPGKEPSYVVGCAVLAALGDTNVRTYSCAEPTSYPSRELDSDNS